MGGRVQNEVRRKSKGGCVCVCVWGMVVQTPVVESGLEALMSG